MKKLRVLDQGDQIRQRWLADLTRQLNTNTRFIARLRDQFESMGEPDVRTNRVDAGGGGGIFSTGVFTESSRAATAVTVTDSAGETHTYSKVTQIVLTNSASETLTLNLTPPT